MIGYRGAARYLSPDFADCFALECDTLRHVRDVRQRGSCDLLATHGLERGQNDPQVIMMRELPSNAVIADAFLDHFDGFSIGSNDVITTNSALSAPQDDPPPHWPDMPRACSGNTRSVTAPRRGEA